ncbi:MAG: hypothetical protein DYG98_26890 [Haliscomenobacteraceae bacterium CHB4]|nr:hypothetical protein [Haliscomenobacteraceae bacterium CHB4]
MTRQYQHIASLRLFSAPNDTEIEYRAELDKNKKTWPAIEMKPGVFFRKKKRTRRRYRPEDGSLFDIEEGQKKYNILLECHKSGLYNYWESLKPANRVSLIKYVAKINSLYISADGEKQFRRIIHDVAAHNHFPAVMAKVFFEIIFNNGHIGEINRKLRLAGWQHLSLDEKIAILYDLSCLYPELMNHTGKIYDIAREEPGYLEPLVVKELNRLALLDGNYEHAREKFGKVGWRGLSVDEKIVLTNGLCKKHRGITENLNQVLYNIRIYNELPAVVIAEKYNNEIDRYLEGGIMTHLVGTIHDFSIQSGGELIAIKGVGMGKIRETLERHRAALR